MGDNKGLTFVFWLQLVVRFLDIRKDRKMASIIKRRDRKGKYLVFIRRAGYTTKTKYFTTLRDARAWSRLMEGNLDKRNIKGKDNSNYTLTKLIHRYINVVLTYKQATTQDREGVILKSFIRRCKFAHLNVNDIKSFHFARYRDERREARETKD